MPQRAQSNTEGKIVGAMLLTGHVRPSVLEARFCGSRPDLTCCTPCRTIFTKTQQFYDWPDVLKMSFCGSQPASTCRLTDGRFFLGFFFFCCQIALLLEALVLRGVLYHIV